MIIFIDLDGVIADFDTAFAREFEKAYPEIPVIPPSKRKSWSVRDEYGLPLRTEVDAILNRPGFFESFPPVPGAVDALYQIQGLARVEVFILTSPLSSAPDCHGEKVRWVRKHFPGFVDRLIIASDKTILGIRGDVLLDDKPTIQGVRLLVMTHVVYGRPYNRHVTDKPRLESWASWERVLRPILGHSPK